MKKEKVGLTTTNWILCILGILLCVLVIVLPPIFRQVFKEEEIVQPEPEPVYETVTTICKKDNITQDNYTDSEIITFSHKNLKLKSYTKVTNRVYIDPILYQEEKQNYGILVTQYASIDGYNYSIGFDDDLASFTITEEYDLETMESLSDTELSTISILYELNSSITTIQSHLTANGYTCGEE